jgi:hypothetical protein
MWIELLRNYHGAWCGYVVTGPSSPWYGIQHHTVADMISHDPGLNFTAHEADRWRIGWDYCHEWHSTPRSPDVSGHYVTMREALREAMIVAESMKNLSPTPADYARSLKRICWEIGIWAGDGEYSTRRRGELERMAEIVRVLAHGRD